MSDCHEGDVVVGCDIDFDGYQIIGSQYAIRPSSAGMHCSRRSSILKKSTGTWVHERGSECSKKSVAVVDPIIQQGHTIGMLYTPTRTNRHGLCNRQPMSESTLGKGIDTHQKASELPDILSDSTSGVDCICEVDNHG